MKSMEAQEFYTKGMEHLIDVVQQLSLARTLEEVIEITRHAARELTGADGAAFVLRDEDRCYYVDEDAIGPLWKGKKFPMSACISGWAMQHKQSVSIEDIFKDSRIPIDAYRPTFVKSLLMVPIRKEKPIGAIGNYWAKPYKASVEQEKLLQALADSTSIALENVQLYTSLIETNEYLEDSVQARDEFFNIASHELRTPITAMKLQLQMTDRKIKKHSDILNDAQTLLNTSMRQLDKLSLQVEQLLDVSRIRLGQMTLDYGTSNCSSMLKRVIELYQSEFNRVGCVIFANIQENIKGEWDTGKIEQVFGHLLSNVIRHAPSCNVHISLELKEDNVIFTVKDEGPGISEDLKQRLLQRFERSHAPRHLGGLGLGLYIVRSILDAHGGFLSLDSMPDKGTKIVAGFPIHKP